MSESRTATLSELLTARDVRRINKARDVLKALEERATQYGYTHTSGPADEARAYDCGRLAERAETAGYELFQVLNSASAYGLAELTPAQVHNQGAK